MNLQIIIQNRNTPLKSNIDIQNDAMFETGDTFSKAHHFWYRHLRFLGCNPSKYVDMNLFFHPYYNFKGFAQGVII